MLLVPSFLEIKDQIKSRYGSEKRLVGIMLANYETNIVSDVIAKHFKSWDIESGATYDVFWPGYVSANVVDKPGLIPVNFSSAASMSVMHQALSKERLKNQSEKNYKGINFSEHSKYSELFFEFENENRICFDREEYIKAKRVVRESFELTKHQKIDSLTLVITWYNGESLQLTKSNSIFVNLREISKGDDVSDKISELMSEINIACSKGTDIAKLKKQIKILKGAEGTWKTVWSVIVDVLSLLKP